MAPVAGFNAKVRVGGVYYTCTRWSVRDSITDEDITNTEGTLGGVIGTAIPGYETRVGGPAVAEVTVTNASYDEQENVFDPPRSVTPRNYIPVRIYPAGLSGKYWDFPSLLIQTVEHTGEARGLSPITFTGRTDGSYTEPA
jgi:hypothetical protein